jgi:mannose-1-phosphate guanylyltransferase
VTPFALILAGGRGTRFWPLSRRALPKQCLSLDGGPTLLQRTVSRLSPLIPPERVIVVTGPDMVEPVRAQLPACTVLVEPSGRNTAPAIIWGAVEVSRRGGDQMVVLPSDHHIADEAAFRDAIATALGASADGALLTLGIRPTRPETGFGWIEPGDGPGPDLPVRRFVEKPPLTVAEVMYADGRHLWNAGMFVWRVDALLEAVAAHLPGATRAVMRLGAGASIEEVWADFEATSIDYGIMEKAERVRTLPVDFGWSDVGSWPALAEVLEREDWGAGTADVVIARDAAQNLVHARGKLVALLGVDNLIVVDTEDALLVARRDRAQEVRHLLEEIERRGLGRYG